MYKYIVTELEGEIPNGVQEESIFQKEAEIREATVLPRLVKLFTR